MPLVDDRDPSPPTAAPTEANIRNALGAVGRLARGHEDDGDFDAALGVIGDATCFPDQLDAAFSLSSSEGDERGSISIVNETWISCAVWRSGKLTYADPSLRRILSRPTEYPGLPDQIEAFLAGADQRRCIFGNLRLAAVRSMAVVVASSAHAASWPLPEAAKKAASARGAIVILAFTPAEEGGLAGLIGPVFGLTRGEAALAAALFEVATMEDAAMELGISATTARERIRVLYRKTGSARRADLTAKITELLAGDYLRIGPRTLLMKNAFGLSNAEARVADAVTQGLTVPSIALRNGVSAHTVRAQLDAVLLKTGTSGASELAKLTCEICALASWTSCEEPRRLDQRRLLSATRIVAAPRGRQIAAADYGPADGQAILLFHAGYCHRWVRRRFADALISRRYRAVSFDFPDCGLTDGVGSAPFFEAIASDAQTILEAFKIKRVKIFAEFGGACPALAFAARCPDLVESGLLLMPRPPRIHLAFPGPLQRAWHGLVSRPELALAMYETMRLRGGSRFWRWLQSLSAQAVTADREAMLDTEFVAERISEMSASCAKTAAGIVALDQAYLSGWTEPPLVGGAKWTIVQTAARPFQGGQTPEELWGWLPGARIVSLPDAGRLATHTHARQLVDLIR